MSSMPKKTADESDVKDDVKKVLNAHGWFWWMPPANMYGKSGASDFHAVKDGLFMSIETKRGMKKPEPTANQIAFLQAIRNARHFAFVVNATRVKHLDAFLGSLCRSIAAAQRTSPALRAPAVG